MKHCLICISICKIFLAYLNWNLPFPRPAELHTSQTWKDDGTNSLVFKLLEKKKKHLYTHIMVDIGATPALPRPSRRKRINTWLWHHLKLSNPGAFYKLNSPGMQGGEREHCFCMHLTKLSRSLIQGTKETISGVDWFCFIDISNIEIILSCSAVNRQELEVIVLL